VAPVEIVPEVADKPTEELSTPIEAALEAPVERPTEASVETPIEPAVEVPVEEPVEVPAEEPSEPSSSSKKKNKKKKKKGKSVDLGDQGEEKSLETPAAEAAPEPEVQPEFPTVVLDGEVKKDEGVLIPSEPEAQHEIVPEVMTETVAPIKEPSVAERDVTTEDGQLPREIQSDATELEKAGEPLSLEEAATPQDTPPSVEDKRAEDVYASPLAESSTPDEALRSQGPEVPATEELPAAQDTLIRPEEGTTVPAAETLGEGIKEAPAEPLTPADIEPIQLQEPEEPASDAGLSKKAKKKKKKKAAAATAAAAAVALKESLDKQEPAEDPTQAEDVTGSEEKGPVVADEVTVPTEPTESTPAPEDNTAPVTDQDALVPEEAVPAKNARPEESSDRHVEPTEVPDTDAPKSTEEISKSHVEPVPTAGDVSLDVQDAPQLEKDMEIAATDDKQIPVDEIRHLEDPAVPTEEPTVARELTETAVEEPNLEPELREEVASQEQAAENEPQTTPQGSADALRVPGEPGQQEQDLSLPTEVTTLPVRAEEVTEQKPEEEVSQPETEAFEPSLSRKASKKKKKNKRKSTAEPEPEAETKPQALEPQAQPETLENFELEPEAKPVSVEDAPKSKQAEEVSDVTEIPAEEKPEEVAPEPVVVVASDDAEPTLVEEDPKARHLEETPIEPVAQEPALEVADEVQAADEPAKVEETPEESAEGQPKKKSKKKKNRKSTLVSEPEHESQPEREPETKPEEPVSTTEEAVAPPETSGQAPQPQPLDDSEQQLQEQQEDAGTADTQAISAPLEKLDDEPKSVEDAETNDSEPHVPEQPTVEPEAGEPSSSTGKKSKKKKNKKQSVSVPAEESSIPDLAAAAAELAPQPETPAADEPAPDAVSEPVTETPVALEEQSTAEPIVQEPAEEMSRDIDVPAESSEVPIAEQPEPAEAEVEQESAPPMTAAQKKKAKKDKKKRQSLAADEPQAEAVPSVPVVEKESSDVPAETPIQYGKAAKPEPGQADVVPVAEQTKEPAAEQSETDDKVPESLESVAGAVTEHSPEEAQESVPEQAQAEAKDELVITSEADTTKSPELPSIAASAPEEPTTESQPTSEEQKIPGPDSSAITETTFPEGEETTRVISIPSDAVDPKADDRSSDEQPRGEPILDAEPVVDPAIVELTEDIQDEKPEEPQAIAESVPETPTEETQPISSKKDKKKKKKKRQSVSADEPVPEVTATQEVEPSESPAEQPASDTAVVPDEPVETQAEPAADSVEPSQEAEQAAEPVVTPEATPEGASEEQASVPLDEDIREPPTEPEPEQPAVAQQDAASIPDDQETPKNSISEEPAAAPGAIEPQQQEQEQPAEDPQTTSSKKKNKKKKKKSQSSAIEEEPHTPTAEGPILAEPTESITDSPVTAEPEEVAPEESPASAVEESQPAVAESANPVPETPVVEEKEPEVPDAAPAEEVQTASSKKKAKKDKKKRKSVSFAAEEPSQSAQLSESTEPAETTEAPVSDAPEDPAEHQDQPTAPSEQAEEQKSEEPVLTDVPTPEAEQRESSMEPQTTTVQDVATDTPSDEQSKDELEASEITEEPVPSADPEQMDAAKDISEANNTEANSEPEVSEPFTPVEPATEAAESEAETPKSKKSKKKKKRKTLELKEDEPTVPLEAPEPAESSERNLPDLTETPTAEPDTTQVEEPVPEAAPEPASEPVEEPAPEAEKQDDEPKSAKAKKKAKKEKKRQSKLLAAESEPSTPTEEKPEEPATPAEPTEIAAEKAPLETTEEQGPDTQIPTETAISPAEDDGKDNQSHDTGFHADTDKDLTWTDHDVSSQVEQQQTASTEPEREREGVEGAEVAEPVEETIVQVQPEVVEEIQQPSADVEASGDVDGEDKKDVENEVIPSVEVAEAGNKQVENLVALETEVPIETETVPEKDVQPIVPEVADAVEEPIATGTVEEPASQLEPEPVLEAEPSAPAAEAEKPESGLPTRQLSKKQKKKQRQAQKAAAEEEQAATALHDDSEKPAEAIAAEEQPAGPVIPEETEDKAIVSEVSIADQQVPGPTSENDKKSVEAAVEAATDEAPTFVVVQEGAPVPETLHEQLTDASPEETQVPAEPSPIMESKDIAADVAELAVPSGFDTSPQDQAMFRPTELEPVVIGEGEIDKDNNEEVAVESTQEDEPVAVPEPVHIAQTVTQEAPTALEMPEEDVPPPSQDAEEPSTGSSKKKKKKNKKKSAAQIAEATEEAPVTAPESDVQAEIVEEAPKDKEPEPVPALFEAPELETQPGVAREIAAEPFEPQATESTPADIHDGPEQPMITSEVVEDVSPAPILETIPVDVSGQEDQSETTREIEQIPQAQIAEPALEAETTKEEQPVLPAEPALETPPEEKTVEAPTPVEEPTLSRKQSKKQKKKAKKQAKEQLEESSPPVAAEAENVTDDAVAGADIKIGDIAEAKDVPAVEHYVVPEVRESKEKDGMSGPGEVEQGLGLPEEKFVQEKLPEEKAIEEVVEAQQNDEAIEALPLDVNSEKELDFPQESSVQDKTEIPANLDTLKDDEVEVPSVAPQETEKEPEVLREEPVEEIKVDEMTEKEVERHVLEERPTEQDMAPEVAEPVTETESVVVERELPAGPEPGPEPEFAPVSRKLSKKEKRKLKKQAETEVAKVEDEKEEAAAEPVEPAKDITIPQAAWKPVEEQEKELPLETSRKRSAPSAEPEIEMKEQEVEIPVEPVEDTPIQPDLEGSKGIEPPTEDAPPLSRKLSKKEKKKKRKESKAEEPLESEPIPEPADLREQTVDKSLEPVEVQEARHDDDVWPPIDWAKGKMDVIEQSSQSSDEAHAGRFEPEIPEFKESAIPEALMERPGETPQEAAKESRAQPMTGTIERDVTTRDFHTKSSESALQTLHDVESSSEKAESKPSKIANIFPNLERGFFRRPSPTQSVKDGAEEETMDEAIRDSAIQVLEAPIAREVEMPVDLRDSGYIPSPALAQDDVFGISTTRDLPSTKIEMPVQPTLVPERGSRSIEGTQESASPCDLRRSPSIHGRHEQQGLPWSLEETTEAGSKRDLSPPRPLHLVTEQEPERSVVGDGTPRLEIKPEHILPRPETPVRKFTETALGRRAWPTPDNSDDDWEKIEKPSPRLSPDRGMRPGILKTPEHDKPVLRPSGSASARSSSHSLRRVVHSASGDLRAAALAATAATATAIAIAGEAPEEERQSRPRTPQPQAPAASRSPTDLNVERIASSSSYDPVTDKGKQPVRSMTDVYVSCYPSCD
jgi:hypothetical protein